MSYVITDEQLNAHFRSALADADALVKATANLSGEGLAGIRAKAEESLRALKARAEGAQDAVVLRARSAANTTDAYVHENPWEAIGVAAGVGLLIGVLVARR
jgi:ElaB/YqjD/DUF883 family membrane-anchored ribosome-binding protein